jgi:membrane-bound lytic murein transglycosylase MltF
MLAMLSAGLLVATGCSKKESVPSTAEQAKPAATSEAAKVPAGAADATALVPTEDAAQGEALGSLQLPAIFKRRTGDLDVMLKDRTIRALVFMNPIGFFYDKGRPRGINYEALDELERYVNQKYKTGTLKVKVVFIPVRPNQAEKAITEGMGDVLAHAIVITPAREQVVAFTAPVQKDVKQVIVTGPDLAGASTLGDLSGKEVWVNPISVYKGSLQKVNDDLQKQGKAPIVVKDADKQLMDDDLVEMVNAGLVTATVTTSSRAALWTQVMSNIKAPPDMVIATEGQLGWVLRKDNPQLKAMLDEFVQTHAVGTSFGNTVLRRYLQSTKWITNSSSKEEMAKFNSYVEYFKKYSGEYDFDYLMMAAQGYQESMLDQDRKSRRGAVGVMQVLPQYAAANPINIKNVSTADNNIHAGVKMMRNIADTYFKDQDIDPVNKTLMVFASYNAGPTRIASLRKQAAAQGLNPNKWFGNVELLVAQDIGQETVTYVSNIYKYYVAYKMALEQAQVKKKAMAGAN